MQWSITLKNILALSNQNIWVLYGIEGTAGDLVLYSKTKC